MGSPVPSLLWHRSGVDIDSFGAVREARWTRLRELTRARRLTGAEADELTRLYQATAGDLATVRSSAPEPSVVSRLSVLLATARVWLTGAHTTSTREGVRYLVWGLPGALYRVRWWGSGSPWRSWDSRSCRAGGRSRIPSPSS
ncbi:hypothetical protein GCM10025873_28020 [Demequina sediminis]|nr:hypothetical protein GCM10025873_28020 [Demequina sediminis]